MKFVAKVVLAIVCAVLLIYSVFILNRIMFDKETGKKTNILIVFKSTENSMEFWDTVRAGINTAAKEFDVSVAIAGPKAESDIADQIKILSDALKNKPDAIILAASDYNMLVPVVQKINKAGIPLITIDSGLNSSLPDSFIATDNYEAGRKAGEKLVSIMEKNKRVAIVSHVKGSATAIERENGAVDGLSDDFRSNLSGIYYSEASEEKAYNITKDLLLKNDDIGGLIGLNESSTIGIARAVIELQLRGKVKIIGFDSSLSEVLLIEDDTIGATIVQKPFNMGYLGVKTAVQVLKGEKVSKKINTGSEIITKENMYTKENQKLLFPFVQK